ncbi:UNVERIFIED_CONTAM: hypothetical protein HDU68_006417, partial [Siphonaria sp. JEL0065]
MIQIILYHFLVLSVIAAPIVERAAVPACFPVYSPLLNYPGGSTVSYNGINYINKWWENKGWVPGPNQAKSDSGWVSQGPCSSVSLGTTSSTTKTTTTTTTANKIETTTSVSKASVLSSTKLKTTTTTTTTSSPLPISTEACASGAKLSIVSQPQLQARIGSVFGNVLYNPTNENTNNYKPTALQVRVLNANGSPLNNCKVSWTTASTSNGWIFPVVNNSDATGLAQAYWVAGKLAQQTLKASIVTKDGLISSVQFNGAAQGHNTRSNSIHVSWQTPDFKQFSVDVTPLSWPQSTYYEAIGINNAYTGIQNDRLLFSMWEFGGKNPEIIATHSQTKCNDF